jgi:hypothetical protein
MAISTPDVVTRYFAAQSARDFDTLVTLFADDAIENVASAYEYITELLDVDIASEGKYVARVSFGRKLSRWNRRPALRLHPRWRLDPPTGDSAVSPHVHLQEVLSLVDSQAVALECQ